MPTLNNKQIELMFDKIYYVDSINGADSNNGSKTSPFQSVNYAVTKCGNKGMQFLHWQEHMMSQELREHMIQVDCGMITKK